MFLEKENYEEKKKNPHAHYQTSTPKLKFEEGLKVSFLLLASKFQHRKLKPRRKKKTLSFILFIFLIFSLTSNFWHTCEVFIFPSASNFQH